MNNSDNPTDSLKILIAGTWKSGTTWLTDLLATIYNIPVRNGSDIFDPEMYENFGESWINKQHFSPETKLLEWLKKNKVFVITTTRHPADILVSLIHHRNNYPTDFAGIKFITPKSLDAVMKIGLLKEDLGNTAYYVRKYFHASLATSIHWIASGEASQVRYEDLLENTCEVLTALTDLIRPVKRETIERAIEQNTLAMLREVNGRREFFWQGEAGNWATTLPDSIIEIFRKTAPYPHIFKTSGYNLDVEKNRIIKAWEVKETFNPFKEKTRQHFDNGIRISPVIQRLYMGLAPEMTVQWEEPTATGSGTFYEWLNQPYSLKESEEPSESKDLPLLTNLAANVARQHIDYRALFPDYAGRAEFFISGNFYKMPPITINFIMSFPRQCEKALLNGQTVLRPKTRPVIWKMFR